MENCDVPIALRDHNYTKNSKVSARRPAAAKSCRNEQEQKHHHSATSDKPPQKRKRTSVVRPSQPSQPSAGPPEVSSAAPQPSSSAAEVSSAAPQPSSSAPAIPGSLSLARRRIPIQPEDLPVASNVAPCRPGPSTAPLQDDGPLMMNNHPVEEYQKIYHEVVDDMLRYKSGRLRPYSVGLGRCIKQKLWERLNRPTLTESVDEDGLVKVEVSQGAGVYPPLYLDISDDDIPIKRAKNKK